jgi:predicted secreted protein
MPTQASSAYGTQLKMGTAPGTLIPELTNLTDVGGTFATVDVSAHDGTSGWGSKIPTLLDGGVVRATFNYVPGNAQHVALRTAMLNRTSTVFTVVWPTTGAPTVSFNAFITRYRIPAAPVNGALVLETELTVDGAVTFT